MQTYPVTFLRNPVVVMILVVVPLIIVAIFLAIMLSLPHLPDWAALVGSFVMMGCSIAAVLFLYKKWAAIKAEVTLSEDGIVVKLLEPSPFYPKEGYQSSWEGVENVSTNFDTKHYKRFYMVRFRNQGKAISLSPTDDTDKDTETAFGEALLGYVSRFNSQHQSLPDSIIRQRGFYDTWWAKALTVFTYLMFAGVVIMKLTSPASLDFWRIVQVAIFGTLWLSVYYTNRKHSKA
jgi:hypothetical protein